VSRRRLAERESRSEEHVQAPEAMAVKIAPARISSLGCAESTTAISRSLRTGVSGTSDGAGVRAASRS